MGYGVEGQWGMALRVSGVGALANYPLSTSLINKILCIITYYFILILKIIK